MGPRPRRLNILSLSFMAVVVVLRPTAFAQDDYGDEMMGSPSDEHSPSDICYVAKDPKKCESTVQSMSPGLKTTTPLNVVTLHIEAARRNTKAGQQAAAQLIKEKPALDACVAKYEAAARGIEDIAKELAKEAGDAYTIVSGMTSVPDHCLKCDDQIKGADAKAQSPMAKYSSENAQIMKNAMKIYRTYWSVTDQMASHSKKNDAIDMDYVRAVCDKADNTTECVNSVLVGAKLAQFKGPTNGLVMVKLSGRAIQKTREDAIKIIAEKRKVKGSPAALHTCDTHYAEAGKDIDKAFNDLSAAESTSDVKDVPKLQSHLAKATHQFKKCQDAMDKDRGHVDATLLDLQKRLLNQAMNNEALARIMWS